MRGGGAMKPRTKRPQIRKGPRRVRPEMTDADLGRMFDSIMMRLEGSGRREAVDLARLVVGRKAS